MVPTDFTFNNLVAMNIYQIDLFFQKELLILVYYNVVDWSPISIVCKQLFLPKWMDFLDLRTSRHTMKSPVKVGMKRHLSLSFFAFSSPHPHSGVVMDRVRENCLGFGSTMEK